MSNNQPDLSKADDREPPLGLNRESYGYLVLSAGVASAFVALYYFPESVPYWRLTRLFPALVIATITGFVYRYVTTTWYDQFIPDTPDDETA